VISINIELLLLFLSVFFALVAFLANRLFFRIDKLTDKITAVCVDYGGRIARIEARN
jgi:hypothetical protein